MQVSRAKYARTHTERHHQHGCLYYQDTLYSSSNHGEGIAVRKLSRDICQISSQTSRTEKNDQVVG